MAFALDSSSIQPVGTSMHGSVIGNRRGAPGGVEELLAPICGAVLSCLRMSLVACFSSPLAAMFSRGAAKQNLILKWICRSSAVFVATSNAHTQTHALPSRYILRGLGRNLSLSLALHGATHARRRLCMSGAWAINSQCILW